MGKLELMVPSFTKSGTRLLKSFCFSCKDQLATFLLGEAKLEQYLEEHPPYEHQTAQAKIGLIKAKQLLTLPSGADGSRTTGSMDAQLLLAKLHFACGNL